MRPLEPSKRQLNEECRACKSRVVIAGKREPHGRPSGPSEDGPVVPWQPPRMLGHMTHQRSVSMAAPGPISGFHHPGAGCPGPVPPAAWLSPVRACRTSTALSPDGDGVPHVSYATEIGPSEPPSSSSSGVVSNSRTNARRPAGSPGRQAQLTGSIAPP